MQTTDTLNANPVIDWWISAQPIFADFAQYIETSPLTAANAATMAHEIRDLYEAIGEIDYPHEADDVYDHFTRALISLFMSFESAGYGNWKQAEIYLGRAVTEWIYTKHLVTGLDLCGCHQRSLAETAVFRFKSIFANRLSTHTLSRQITEPRIQVIALNCMTQLGMLGSYPIA